MFVLLQTYDCFTPAAKLRLHLREKQRKEKHTESVRDALEVSCSPLALGVNRVVPPFEAEGRRGEKQ